MCVSPMKAFVIGHKQNGYPEFKLFPYWTKSVVRIDGYYKPLSIYPTRSEYELRDIFLDYIEVPCGSCVECKLDNAREWSNRCLLEMQYHTFNQFVTLTYDDAHIPYVEYDGIKYPTLVKRDVQLFLKRLRDKKGPFRYFGSGEYGEKGGRPHYHLILFGLALDDLQPFGGRAGNKYYISETIMNAWHYKGHCILGQVNESTISYTAKYVLKKSGTLDTKELKDKGIQPPYAMMSRRPGIGRRYYDEVIASSDLETFFERNNISLSLSDTGKTFSVPKYYRRILRDSNPDLYDRVRSSLIKRASSTILKRETDVDEEDYNMIRERNIIAQQNRYKRIL